MLCKLYGCLNVSCTDLVFDVFGAFWSFLQLMRLFTYVNLATLTAMPESELVSFSNCEIDSEAWLSSRVILPASAAQ